VLQELHWLSVQGRVSYKTELLVYKCVHGLAPATLSRLTTDYAKNYCNRTLIVQGIVENVVTCFLQTHCAYCIYLLTYLLSYLLHTRPITIATGFI